VQRYELAESKPQPLRTRYLFLLNDQLLVTTKGEWKKKRENAGECARPFESV
jgi:hypothetical protein